MQEKTESKGLPFDQSDIATSGSVGGGAPAPAPVAVAVTAPAVSEWHIFTRQANYNGFTHRVRFIDGHAVVKDRDVARRLVSDFGYKADPGFDDLPGSGVTEEWKARRYALERADAATAPA